MKDYRFWPESGNFYKANLHCHTVISDGQLTKEEVKAEYRKRGYSIIAFTDHMIYGWHKELSDENFLAIAGIEVNINETDKPDYNHTKTYHLNFYDQKPETSKAVPLPEFDINDKEALNKYLEEICEMGFVVCYNHPYWSLQDYDDYKDLKGLFAMEIYNHGCEHDGLYGYQPQSYEEMLRTGQKIFALATDDNHNFFPMGHQLSDSFGGWIMVKAPNLEYDTVMNAITTGNFYWSMGPEIHDAYIKDGVLTVKTSPVKKIYVNQEGRDCYKEVAAPGETITEASFPLRGNEAYVRVVVQDADRNCAGTNPCFLEDIR